MTPVLVVPLRYGMEIVKEGLRAIGNNIDVTLFDTVVWYGYQLRFTTKSKNVDNFDIKHQLSEFQKSLNSLKYTNEVALARIDRLSRQQDRSMCELDEVIDLKSRGLVHTKILSKMLNITEISSIDFQDTHFKSVEKIKEGVYLERRSIRGRATSFV